MKKRVAAILFASVLALSLCACGGDTNSSTASADVESDATTQQAEDPKPVEETQEPEDTVPQEYKNALAKAEQYNEWATCPSKASTISSPRSTEKPSQPMPPNTLLTTSS